MIKLTKRLKNKKNRTFKRGGAAQIVKNPEKLNSIEVLPNKVLPNKELPNKELPNKVLPNKELPNKVLPNKELPNKVLPNKELPKEERQGIIDIIRNKIADAASSGATFVGDTGLKIIGLERIDASKKVDDNIDKIGDAASGIVSDVSNVVDKTGAALIENVNEVLGSSITKETTKEAAKKTADIIKEGAETFNKALNDPEVKAELEEAIKNAGEVGSVIVESAKKPLEKVVEVTADSVEKATGAALGGIIKVGTDGMAAIPYVGTAVEIGKMLNDSSKAASAMVEAGSEAVGVASDAFIEINENIEKGLKVLEEKKKLVGEISSRTDKSIKEFENPLLFQAQAAGARKTRRSLFKNKAKSKRVRFAI
jgi:hypothetical protein